MPRPEIAIRERVQRQEEEQLSPFAALSRDHNRFVKGEEDDYRLPYKRDVDRILHSNAYSRYGDKTQVVYLLDNDHISHRSLHVQLVSSFARGIGRILGLNLDLIEAIALGHDVGHPPFGHEGERYLSDLSIAYGRGPFSHPLQSCRLLTLIEPLNLGLAVYDGFLCHDGGMSERSLRPQRGKRWEDHLAEREAKQRDPEIPLLPMTLEGCLVKLCDTVSYLSRDIEDAIRLGLIDREQIPMTLLGKSHRSILSAIGSDLIANSAGQDALTLSETAFEALQEIRHFNFSAIYFHPRLKTESAKLKRSYQTLFSLLVEDLSANAQESFIWKDYLSNKSPEYLAETATVQKVIDYISGMTDRFFLRVLEKFVVPQRMETLRAHPHP